MPKLSSNQLFIIVLAALAILAGVAYLDRTYLPVLVGILLGVIQLFAHINGGAQGAANLAQGVNIGVPLQAPDAAAAPAIQGEPG